jgi:hypothetical protein
MINEMTTGSETLNRIVERLRSRKENVYDYASQGAEWQDDKLCGEAADEIERLRAENERLQDALRRKYNNATHTCWTPGEEGAPEPVNEWGAGVCKVCGAVEGDLDEMTCEGRAENAALPAEVERLRDALDGYYDLVTAAQSAIATYLAPGDEHFDEPTQTLSALIRLFDGPEQRAVQALYESSDSEPTCPRGPCKSYGSTGSPCEWPTCAVRAALTQEGE